jgi:hypothetical protein
VTEPPAIGGVMAAEPAGAPVAGSVWDAWAAPFARSAAFANARSALAALLRDRAVKRAWLPAYACQSLAEGAMAGAGEVRFYPVGADLDLADESWAGGLAPSDAVLAVDYFGRPPGEAWRRLRSMRPDVLWIEDRAQALDVTAPPLGEVILYSPRKLVGVGEGGLLFSATPLPQPARPSSEDLWAPEDARALDPNGYAPDRWRPLFQAREAAMDVAETAASRRTLAALESTKTAPIAEARKANWRRLAAALPDYALWPTEDPAFAPLAFPILVEDAGAAVAALAAQRIWAPRHWADPPSPASDFPEAHRLAARCVSLPLDQRYGAAEMDRIIDAVRRLARPSSRSRR